jgi:multidrug efflux pump subunit AcrB
VSLPSFGVTKPVPVNLLMAAAIIGGVVAALNLTREFFPEITPEAAQVTLPYPGATPQEIEEGMAMKVEDALSELDEVDRMTTTLAEGGGGMIVEFRSGVDVRKAIDDVERAIDTLQDLPEEAEEIEIAEFEPKLPVIMITLYGAADEETLKRAIHRVRDDLRTLPGMGEILLSGVRDYEIRVDVAEAALLEHGLSLPAVSEQIRAWMADVPGGAVRTGEGDIRVRTTGVEERAEAIREIVVRATPDGQALRVGDIARVREDYVDQLIVTRFNSQPSVSLTVFKTGDQDAVQIAKMARAYVAGRRGDPFEARWKDKLNGVFNGMMPEERRVTSPLRTPRREAYELGASAPEMLPGELVTHSDLARFIEGRLDLLLRNARWGALLVFSTLFFFLNWRVALWVGTGLVISLSGTLVLMSAVGITLNLLTMFGLIVVLGLLVDDAIVVAENIQARHDRKEPSLVAAIRGAEQVFWPVVATVLTSIVAFMPLRFIRGQLGDLLGALPLVVACALALSLVESLLILPSHMGHSLMRRDKLKPGRFSGAARRFEAARDNIILNKIVPGYARLLRFLIHHRYVTVAGALAVLISSVGMVAGDRIEFTFLPKSDTETIIVDVRMPVGTAIDRTDGVVKVIEESASAQPEIKSVASVIGIQADLDNGQTAGLGGHLAQIYVELTPVEERVRRGERESASVIAGLRETLGDLPTVERITYTEIQGGPGGADMTIQVTGQDSDAIETVVGEIKGMLADYEGVYDIADDSSRGQREVRVKLKQGAAALGLTVADVATQVRGALFGLEPHVFSALQEDIKVRVRLDEHSRHSLWAIENMFLIMPDGRRVPLSEVAEVEESTSYSVIKRVDRRRAVSVLAETAPGTRPEPILAELSGRFRELEREHPGVRVELAGLQREFKKAFDTLPLGFLAACVMIYVILAWLFGSFIQPLALMLAIPFSAIGVIWGHMLLGYQMTFLSLIGIVALSGIVVNDSLILVEFYNRRKGASPHMTDALVAAGRARLRPIFLTTITTVLGLTPLMLEKSFQAKFLIPMAISISFGLMSATFLILIALPCFMVIIDDLKAGAYYLWHGRKRPFPATERSVEPHVDRLAE